MQFCTWHGGHWIPAFAGMTRWVAGMTTKETVTVRRLVTSGGQGDGYVFHAHCIGLCYNLPLYYLLRRIYFFILNSHARLLTRGALLQSARLFLASRPRWFPHNATLFFWQLPNRAHIPHPLRLSSVHYLRDKIAQKCEANRYFLSLIRYIHIYISPLPLYLNCYGAFGWTIFNRIINQNIHKLH